MPYYVAFFAWLTCWVLTQQVIGLIRGAHRRPNRPRARLDHGRFMVSQLLIMTALTAITVAAFSMRHAPLHELAVIVGSAIAAAGFALTVAAQWYLGANWAGTPGIQGVKAGHVLVQRGPYRLVRHPMYTGLLVTAIGLGLGSWNPFYAAGCLAFAAAFLVRAPGEEQALRSLPRRKGGGYAAYAARTGAFFPKLGRRPTAPERSKPRPPRLLRVKPRSQRGFHLPADTKAPPHQSGALTGGGGVASHSFFLLASAIHRPPPQAAASSEMMLILTHKGCRPHP